MADTPDTTPLCPVCECGVVDDLVHIEHVHLGEVAAHNECLPVDVMLDAILSARKTAADAQALAADLGQRCDELAAKRNPDDDVLVEGTWFHPDDLPKILGNYMRSVDEEQRRTKDAVIALEAARARIAELENAQREPIGYVIGTVIGTDPGRVELYGDQVLTKEESAEWLENLKTNLPADVWRVVELREVTE